MKLTRQQRLGLVLTGILMALVALVCALARPAAAVDVQNFEPAQEQPRPAARQKKAKPQPAPPPAPRRHLEEDF